MLDKKNLYFICNNISVVSEALYTNALKLHHKCSEIDLLVLLFSLLLIQSYYTFGIVLSNQNDSAYKLLIFLRRFIFHASSWITVLTAFDRFTFALYGDGKRFRFLKSKRNLIYIILLSFTIISIIDIDIPNFFFYLWKNGDCKADFSIQISSDIITSCLRTYFPFFIMFMHCFNLIIY